MSKESTPVKNRTAIETIRFVKAMTTYMIQCDSATHYSCADNVLSTAPAETSGNGFGYELIQSKLDLLDYRFSELFVHLKEQGEGFLNNQRSIEAEQRQLNLIVDRHERKIVNLVEGMEDAFGANVSLITDQSRQILELQTFCSNHDHIQNELLKLRPKIALGIPDCSEKLRSRSEVCRMSIAEQKTTVYMDQHRFGGHWLVVLQRFDGSEDFHRNWSDYRNGFGTVGQEFWLGLERLHQLTKNTAYEVLMEMEDFAENYRYARYTKFAIGPEANHYSVDELGTYSGTAGDSFTAHKLSKFTALDNGPRNECNKPYTGGWWYFEGRCYDTHLTGKWDKTDGWTSIVWKSFGSPAHTALRYARMMIRKV
ncbi:angiopoietin-related protein 2-like [Ochlerotatus camptorhynchus]|uniref:angiopoietin-related protein 2-like n=1 Tax=Ochlerotatus camptorhynchus TaxID=644619 RepID=UPI0031DAC0BB